MTFIVAHTHSVRLLLSSYLNGLITLGVRTIEDELATSSILYFNLEGQLNASKLRPLLYM